jgi:hypothetical protein
MKSTNPAVRYDRGSPTIVVVNESSDADASELKRAVFAIQKQVDRDFFPLWGWRAELLFEPDRIPPKAMRITIKDSDEDSDLGYHFIDGLPRTEVFTRDSAGKRYREYYSTLSHEVLEMIADPGVNLYASGYYIKRHRHYRAWIPYEVCDPVEDKEYEIFGFPMSDFVVPEWFEPEREPRSMKFSFCDSIDRPFALTSGGYTDAVVGTKIRTEWGGRANRKRRRHRFVAREKILRKI